LEVLTVAVPVALAGAVFLQRRRRAAGVGADWWGWAALVAGLAVTTTAYVTGPGPIQVWLAASVQRTMLFPLLAAWWIVAAWVVIATGEIRNPRSTSVDQA
jgi:hypothetical protein